MPLVTTTEMFKKAYDGGYAIGAFNVNNMEIVQGITEACQEEKAPVILQVSKGARAYANHNYLVKLVEAAVICCPDIPIALHLDHGPDFETCKACVDGGFTSVMIDASSKPFEENIEITRKVVEYAHDHGVVVEAELGTLAGIEDDVKVAAHAASYTRPEEVEEFVTKTGCDSLAIAIGTSHGAYKFKPEQCTRNEKGILVPPPLRFDVLEEVSRRLPGFPIVLHGSSSVPQEFVKMINENGGKMPDAVGIPEEQLRHAAELSVCKINIDSDLRLAMTGTIRQFFNEHPDKFDPREYLKPARANIKELVRHKLRDVLGCAGKAYLHQKIVPHRGAIFYMQETYNIRRLLPGRHHQDSVRRGVRRSQLHSASAEAVKAPYPLAPSSFPNCDRCAGSQFGTGGQGRPPLQDVAYPQEVKCPPSSRQRAARSRQRKGDLRRANALGN